MKTTRQEEGTSSQEPSDSDTLKGWRRHFIFVSAGERRRGRFEFPDAFLAIWMIAMFVAFGLLSNLFDGESFAYNLGQGALIALLVGAVLYLVRWAALSRSKAVRQTGG